MGLELGAAKNWSVSPSNWRAFAKRRLCLAALAAPGLMVFGVGVFVFEPRLTLRPSSSRTVYRPISRGLGGETSSAPSVSMERTRVAEEELRESFALTREAAYWPVLPSMRRRCPRRELVDATMCRRWGEHGGHVGTLDDDVLSSHSPSILRLHSADWRNRALSIRCCLSLRRSVRRLMPAMSAASAIRPLVWWRHAFR